MGLKNHHEVFVGTIKIYTTQIPTCSPALAAAFRFQLSAIIYLNYNTYVNKKQSMMYTILPMTPSLPSKEKKSEGFI